jgi:acetylornithine deacetylase/succinyl-diaminopimelate desuccinylase-like protein
MVPGKPIVLLTWEGKDPHLPAILLNSHVDVVPVTIVRFRDRLLDLEPRD